MAHGGDQIRVAKGLTEVSGRVLDRRIGIEKQVPNRGTMKESNGECFKDESRVDGIRHARANEPAAEEVATACEEERTLAGLDVGNVSDPDLVRCCRAGSLCEVIWRDAKVVIADGGAHGLARMIRTTWPTHSSVVLEFNQRLQLLKIQF